MYYYINTVNNEKNDNCKRKWRKIFWWDPSTALHYAQDDKRREIYKYFLITCLPNCKTLDPLLTVVTEMPISCEICLWVCQDCNCLRSSILSPSSTISCGVMMSSRTASISVVLILDKKLDIFLRWSVKYMRGWW